ncbi:MAG TPA: dihydrofolate reductase [Candidatus Nanoarchaeia archaeon]|nr:dihydrofolate reductase [Candidatus Nanoarchaeia archaeon]
MSVSIIVAADENNVIGGHNTLLWKLPDELKRFRALTKGHTIIMGRKTHDSIGRPLPDRRNIVISRSDEVPEGCELTHSLEEALELAGEGEVFIIGGGEIYKQALEKDLVDTIYFTRVHGTFDGDVTFPELDKTHWRKTHQEEHAKDTEHPFSFTYIDYVRNN